MNDAGISDPRTCITSRPKLRVDHRLGFRDAETRHQTLGCEVHDSWAYPRYYRARHRRGAGQVPMPKAEQICNGSSICIRPSPLVLPAWKTDSCADRAGCGKQAGAGGAIGIGHSVMRDALDMRRHLRLIRDARDASCGRPRSEDLKGRVVIAFNEMRGPTGQGCGCADDGRSAGDSDVHHHRHCEGGGSGSGPALAIGDPAVFVSSMPCIRDRMRRSVFAIVELDE